MIFFVIDVWKISLCTTCNTYLILKHPSLFSHIYPVDNIIILLSAADKTLILHHKKKCAFSEGKFEYVIVSWEIVYVFVIYLNLMSSRMILSNLPLQTLYDRDDCSVNVHCLYFESTWWRCSTGLVLLVCCEVLYGNSSPPPLNSMKCWMMQVRWNNVSLLLVNLFLFLAKRTCLLAIQGNRNNYITICFWNKRKIISRIVKYNVHLNIESIHVWHH